jgi:polysaccharide export outer membrane protein
MRHFMIIATFAALAATSINGQVTAGAIRTSEASESDLYQIGPGDVLNIRVFNRPLLSREAVRVDERGMISLPLINEIPAACLSEGQLAESIGKAYLEYLKNPHVEVFIRDHQSKPAVVVGAVRAPGRFQMQRQVHLVEIISLAGGLTENAAGRVQVTHSAAGQSCGQSEPKESVEWFDMNELLANNASGNAVVPVRPGDTVNLLEANKAYVIGNVINPVTVALKEEITVSQAIAMAGGTAPDSNLDRIRVTRSGADGPRGEIIVNLKAIKRNQAEDIRLHANDIVEVSSSNGKKIMRGLLNSIIPTVSRLPVTVIR